MSFFTAHKNFFNLNRFYGNQVEYNVSMIRRSKLRRDDIMRVQNPGYGCYKLSHVETRSTGNMGYGETWNVWVGRKVPCPLSWLDNDPSEEQFVDILIGFAGEEGDKNYVVFRKDQ